MAEYFYKTTVPGSLLTSTWELAYHKKTNPLYFDWWLKDNPYQAWAMEGNELASFYNIRPVKVQINGNVHTAGLMNMALTNPSFQGKGHFINIEIGLHEKLREDNFAFAFGFANHQAHRLHRKHAGWIDLAILNQMKILKNEYKGSVKSDCEYHSRTGDLNKDEIFRNRNLRFPEAKINFDRTPEYLSWRLCEHPLNHYEFLTLEQYGETVGLFLFKKFNQSIDLMEYCWNPEQEQFRILEAGITELLKSADSINIWSNLHQEEHLILEKLGFRETEFNTYFGFIPLNMPSGLEHIKDWHYRFLDSDVY